MVTPARQYIIETYVLEETGNAVCDATEPCLLSKSNIQGQMSHISLYGSPHMGDTYYIGHPAGARRRGYPYWIDDIFLSIDQ